MSRAAEGAGMVSPPCPGSAAGELPGADARVLPDTGLVIAAGGSGTRYGDSRPKLLEDLGGLPVFLHCLRTLCPCVPADAVVLVVSAALREPMASALARTAWARSVRLVDGGATRAESVLRGLLALPPRLRFAAVQDAARPLTGADLLRRCVVSARERGSGVAARALTDTIKEADADGWVLRTLDRGRLWAAETPQVFPAADLRRAYATAAAAGWSPTDEAAAVAPLGLPVALVPSHAPNPKITHAGDLPLLRALLALESGPPGPQG